MEDAESEPKISRLISEHDRLAVLCRLLVIDRLDALDEILESGKLSDCAAKNSSDSDLLVERNLMDSYLRKLGGMALVNSVSSSSPRFRRSSTPSLVAKPPVTAANTNGSSAHVNGSLRANGVPPIPSPSIPETPCVKPAAPACPSPISCTGGNSEPQTSVDTRSHLASSWSGGLQQLQRDVTPDDDRAPMCSVPAHGECRPTRCEVSEPPPSPMTTDLLFEFWNNAIKEVGKNESTLSSESACEGKASAESQHFPNLPRQLNSTEFTFTMDTDLQDSHESETDSFQIPKRRATFLLDTDGEDLCGSKVHSEAISTNSPEAVEHGANENGWSPLFNHLTASAKSPTNSAAAASNEVRRPDFPNKSAQLTYGNVASGDNGATFSNAFSAATPFRSSPSSTSIPTQVGWASMLGTPSAHSSTTPSSLGQISTSSADSNSRKRSSYNHSYFMEDSGCFSQNSVPAATDMADALFTTFDPSDFSELMDTTESSMNWPVDV
ncbi:unnamed protein product [Calicophoron daubneyi]|uniref:Uncharacterized protein n=1 Tax=Calicophoron daubneyi TaxID=300641 RepID=A0AAV2TI29_CALDB